MKPGIYDLSSDAYHASEGISRSGIMEFRKSPLHYRHRYISKTNQEKNTAAKAFGSVLHTYILEPQLFDKEYLVVPKVNRQSKAGKDEWAAYEAKAAANNLVLVNESDFENVLRLSEALTANKVALDLIKKGQAEKSIYFTDQSTGVLCKARPDVLHENMVIDLKTSSDGTFRSFQRDIHKYGYYIQAAMIRDGIRAVLNQEISSFIYVVLEVSEPYPVAIYILNEETIDKGEMVYKKELVKFKHCMEANDWPSYEPREINLPPYLLAE